MAEFRTTAETQHDLSTSSQNNSGGKPTADPKRVDRNAWMAAGDSFLVGVTLIALVVAQRAADPSPPIDGAKKVGSAVGWVGVIGAIIVFPSSQLLVRLNQLEECPECARPGLLATFSALGNGVTNLVLCAAFRATGLLETPPSTLSLTWGFFGALDVNLCQLLAAAACQALGIGAAPAIWCGIGMATSFVWGAAIFGEPVKSVVGASLALVLLALGIVVVSSAQTSLPTKVKAMLYRLPESPRLGLIPAGQMQKGLVLTVFMGVFDGSLMAPYKFFVTRSDVNGPAATELTYVYIEAFGIMVTLFFPIYLCVQGLLWRMREGSFKGLGKSLRWCCWPGFWTGVFWAMGNACSVHASEYLGVALGFPLTQACVVICALWGIVLFGEMETCQAKVACALGIIIVLAGATLLAQYAQ